MRNSLSFLMKMGCYSLEKKRQSGSNAWHGEGTADERVTKLRVLW
jgi:hypothetical protein